MSDPGVAVIVSKAGAPALTEPVPGATFSQLPPVVVEAVAEKANGPPVGVEIVSCAVPAAAPWVKEKLRLAGSAAIVGAPSVVPTVTVTATLVLGGVPFGTLIVTVP